MASTYYIWLDNSYTASGHAGTSANPWSFEELNTFLVYSTIVSGDTFKLKGRRTDKSVLYYTRSTEINLDAWDVSVYGPWAIQAQYLTEYVNMSNGIVEFVKYDYNMGIVKPYKIAFENLNNMYVFGYYDNTSISWIGNNINNSILKIDTNLLHYTGSSGTITIQNSIFSSGCYIGVGFQNLIVNNILARASSFNSLFGELYETPFIYTITNSTFDYKITTNSPNITSPIGLFDISVSGNYGPTWSRDYEKGLWGENRFNVGAFYFDELPIVQSATSVTASVANPLIVSAVLNSPSVYVVSAGNALVVANPLIVSAVLNSPDIITSTGDVIIDMSYLYVNVELNIPTITYTENLSGYGHIGSFYFENSNEIIIDSDNLFDVSAILLSPDVSVTNIVSSIQTPFYFPVIFELLQPTVYSFQDFTIDFVGIPRVGSSPLTVDFTANVNFSSENKGIYKVKEYSWSFDYDYTNNISNIPWESTTKNTISHVYLGYRGRQYSVKVCATLELI